MVTERGNFVVVDPELVGHVHTEPLGAHLQGQEDTASALSSAHCSLEGFLGNPML